MFYQMSHQHSILSSIFMFYCSFESNESSKNFLYMFMADVIANSDMWHSPIHSDHLEDPVADQINNSNFGVLNDYSKLK